MIVSGVRACGAFLLFLLLLLLRLLLLPLLLLLLLLLFLQQLLLLLLLLLPADATTAVLTGLEKGATVNLKVQTMAFALSEWSLR